MCTSERTRWSLWFVLALTLASSLGCGRTDAAPPDAAGADATAPIDAAALGDCDAPTALLDVAAHVASGPVSCRTWLDAVRGRVLRNSSGSAVIWSTRTSGELELGVIVSAVHVLGSGWFDGTHGLTPGDDVPESLSAPRDDEHGVMRLRVPAADGAFDPRVLSPQWTIYNPAIPGSQHADVTTILPRHDVFVGLVDGTRVVEGLTAPLAPIFGERQAIAIHDPLGRAEDAVSFADPADAALVILIGFPQAGPAGGAFSIARTLSGDDARDAIEWLAAQGDEEGTIAYEPEVEALVEGHAIAGMSGGGAFDREGRLVGVLVRASDPDRERQIVRVVRMRYVVAGITRARAALDDAGRARVDPYLPL